MNSMSTHSKTFAWQSHQSLSHSYNKYYQRASSIFLLMLTLSSLYYLASNSVDIIWVLAFFVVLVISFSILHLRYTVQVSESKPNQSSNTAPHVVWSIGANLEWEKNGNSGCFVKVFSNRDVYEGEFHEGKCNGSGVYHYYMCGKYEGDWIDGKYDGYGVETWVKGSRYRGQYRNGLRHGIGVYRFYTGDVYEGEWCNGQTHGCGVYSSMDGSMYVGEFKWGVKHGFGHYHYRNGDVYAGEYFADKMHGFGVYKFANGHQYEGSWHEGIRQGLGVYTFRNGETQSGYWENGVLDKSNNQLILPGFPSSSMNPCKVSNVVQEAQQASKRAYSATRMDEQLSKIVAAANRAANAARVAAVKAVQHRMNQGIYNKTTYHMSD